MVEIHFVGFYGNLHVWRTEKSQRQLLRVSIKILHLLSELTCVNICGLMARPEAVQSFTLMLHKGSPPTK